MQRLRGVIHLRVVFGNRPMGIFGGHNEEERMVRGCVKGQPQHQEALYTKYYRKMFGVCLRYAPDRETAEDILQDGFVKVFKNIGSFHGTGSLEGWIRRIMVNTALELLRKKSTMYPVVDLDQAIQTDGGWDIVSSMTEQEILRMVQALPVGYRTVFNLYAIEGYSHKEIAEQLNISEGTSKSQLARARQTLQENIQVTMRENYGAAQSI
jgi:RNA polymerase sigma factor (sigma-70 family)